jgi:cell pole-organizing protein PopZ
MMMGDVSNEPSMEDILSSIKRIIAEEGDAATANRPRRPARPAAPSPVAAEEDEILELNEPAPSEPMQLAPRRAAAPVQRDTPRVDLRDVAPEPASQAAPEPILSPTTAEATRGPLEALSRMVVKPEVAPAPAIPAGETSLEGMVREMIRPMLRDWLDANLPRMVEEMVQREISRIAAGRD